jgi:hypothetical protein
MQRTGDEGLMSEKTVYTAIGKVSCFKFDGITPEATLQFKDYQSRWIKTTIERICKEHGHGYVKVTLEYMGKDP